MNVQSIYTTKQGDFLKGIISREYKTINQLEVNTIAVQIRKLNPRVNLGRHSLEMLTGGLEIKLPQFNFACYARMTGFTQGAHCAAPLVGGTQAVITSYKPVAQLAKHEIFIMPIEALKELVMHPEYKSMFVGLNAFATDLGALARSFATVGVFSKYKIVYKGGKQYISFQVRANWSHLFRDLPRLFRNTNYRIDNPKISGIVYASKHLKEAVVSGAKITIFAYVGLEIVRYFLSDETTMMHFLGIISTDLVKVGISSGVSLGAGAIAGISLNAIGWSVVGGPFVVAVVTGVVAGFILDDLDEQYGITNRVIGMLDAAQNTTGKVVEEAPSYYQKMIDYLEGAIRMQYARGTY